MQVPTRLTGVTALQTRRKLWARWSSSIREDVWSHTADTQEKPLDNEETKGITRPSAATVLKESSTPSESSAWGNTMLGGPSKTAPAKDARGRQRSKWTYSVGHGT